ncbi:protein of unknown function [Tenacibaculum sp. MAR_2010_89]|uniref:FecR family protein n=1 Tax=Tenacibaculum sp. MAR_2010_89 TaxID=1250198 RepID=UPI000898A34A|nr:FecR family protein [Tenacibaculum sp. MAR_2010_89]SEE56708.1 protein of unknown function [Tenacibaculum sp. MAR_2010_89]
MAKRTYNTIHDFLNDSSFKNWAHNSQLSDISFWDFWLKNNPLKKDIAYEARDILLGINFKKTSIPEEKLNIEWNKLETKLKATQNKKNNILNKKYLTLISVAASILILISVGIYTTFLNSSYITHKTAYGETLDLKLKDGTSVTLNSNSSITYKNNNVRKVWLKGEAYFKVNKKETTNAKFWVNTDDLKVEVYGTEFNVNTKKEKTKVYLEEGSIWLTMNNGKSKKMIPGNYIEYSSEYKKITVDEKLISNEEKTSWKNGKLIFNNYTLEEALNKVTDTYGVNFTYKNPETKAFLITGIVPTTNLDICLNAIKKSTNIIIKKENTKLVVYKK